MKTWLITGIGSGIGKALAKEVMKNGDFVIGTFRNQEQVNQFNEQNNGNGKAFLVDLSKMTTIETLVNQASNEFKQIDVLVNNAGSGFIGAIEEASLEETRNIFEVNFFATLQLTRLVLPIMRAQKSGHIIQISSHGGVKAFAGFGIYNASKFALEGYSEALKQEVEPLGIKVTIVEPGPFRTNFASSSLTEAKLELPDYKETASAFRSKLKGVHGIQEGDPDKAAIAIFQLTNSKNPTLRLPLGGIAISTIQQKIDSLKSDLEANKSIAKNAVFK